MAQTLQERLRYYAEWEGLSLDNAPDIAREAADRIDALEAALRVIASDDRRGSVLASYVEDFNLLQVPEVAAVQDVWK